MTPGWPGRAARKRDLGGGCGTWPAGCPGERRSPRRRWPSASRPSGGLGRTPSRLGLVVAVHALDALRALGQQAAALGARLGQRPLVHGEVALRIAVAAVEHAPTPAPGPLDDQLARRLPSLLLELRAGDPGLLLLALHVPAFGVPRASDERSVPTVPLHEIAGRVAALLLALGTGLADRLRLGPLLAVEVARVVAFRPAVAGHEPAGRSPGSPAPSPGTPPCTAGAAG